MKSFLVVLAILSLQLGSRAQQGEKRCVQLSIEPIFSVQCDVSILEIAGFASVDGTSLLQRCELEGFSCTLQRCFEDDSSALTIDFSISKDEAFFDLQTEDGTRVLPVGGCPADPCVTCDSKDAFKLSAGNTISFDLSPFINFEPTPSPTTRTNEETTPAPTPITVDEPTSSPEVTADGNDSNVIVFIAGVALGLMAFSLIAIMTLRKSHYFQKKSKREDSEVKVLPSPYLNTISPKSPNNQLHQVLMQRFSLNSSVGWRTMSIATDISAFSLKTYKTNITEEERRKTQQLRATSVNLSANMSRVHELFRSKAGSTRSDLIRTTREIVNAVHAQIESELDQDSEDTDGNVRLKGFNGEALPFGLEDYMFRLVTGLNSWFSADSKGTGEAAGVRCLLFAVIYLRKIQSLERGFKVTAFNIHRLITVLMLVAAKMTEDELISNQFWADVSGMEMGELNVLEQELCFQTGLDFNVDPTTLRETCREFGVDARMGVSFNGEAPISMQVSP